MLRKLLTVALALALLVGGGDAYAGKGSSGGGKPSFGGGSTFKPSSGGGFKPSFGGGSSVAKPASPSFGGGSSSVKPASPSGGGSSGVKTPTFGGGSSSGGSNGNKGSPSFGGGSSQPKTVTNTPIPDRTPISVSKKPVAESFDKVSGTEQRKVESRKSYEKAEAPASTYKTPAGKEVKIDPKSKETDYLRGRLDESHWQTRYQRSDGFYGGYSSRPIVVYNDYYHPMWNYWLMSQTIDVMSMWVYHHQMSMDRARLDSMYAQNADLRARVAALERQGVPRDPTYTPRGVDADLMYDDGYVNAVYNPRPKTVDEYEYDNASSGGPTIHGVGVFFKWVLIVVVVIIAGFCLYYFMFEYRW